MRRLLSTTVATLALAAGLVISTSSPAAAESAPGCGPVTQIGSTGYITTSTGQTAASVKQFKGCGKNWAYVYVWQSFRDTYGSWKVTAWIKTSSQSVGSSTSSGSEVWSWPTDTLYVCTQGGGQLEFGSQSHYGYTDTRC
ncbi:hypothetical protein [Streptomyces diastatochromogenes]|uniref:hypothetical protein n=1 Tax=Streptomyces diastatochromogenes TaxID=42236 RepID=UPI00142E4156|nr:hypothetical protein [Streptomyces diastatochromogenes]MCZ0989620.1 hypothetical protein [Streptomyces diastatochromogenes]